MSSLTGYMTNIPLSIENTVYRKMSNPESILTMFASQELLHQEWDNGADERWNEICFKKD